MKGDQKDHKFDETENSSDGHHHKNSEDHDEEEKSEVEDDNDIEHENSNPKDTKLGQQKENEHDDDNDNEHEIDTDEIPTKRLYVVVGCLLCFFVIVLITSFVVIAVVEPTLTTDAPTLAPGESILHSGNNNNNNLAPTSDGKLDGDGQGDAEQQEQENNGGSEKGEDVPNIEWTKLRVDSSGTPLQGTIKDGGFGHSIAMATTSIKTFFGSSDAVGGSEFGGGGGGGGDNSENDMVTILVGGSPYSNQRTGHVQIHYLLPPNTTASAMNNGNNNNNNNNNGIDTDIQDIFKTTVLKGGTLGDEFGHTVALNGDGTIVAVSSVGYDNYNGLVQVYQYDTADREWKLMGNPITATTTNSTQQEKEYFGYQLAMNQDGTKLAISSSRYMMNVVNSEEELVTNSEEAIEGYVQVYEWTTTATTTGEMDWSPTGDKIAGTVGLKEECGASIDLSNDGTILAIGCPRYKNNVGRVMVYRNGQQQGIGENDDAEEQKSWVRVGRDLYGDNVDDYFGSELSVLANGLYFAAAAASGWSRVFQYKFDVAVTRTETLTVVVPAEDWYPLGSDISIASLRHDGLFGGSISLSKFRHHFNPNGDGDVVAVDGLVVVHGLYFLLDWASQPGFVTVRWIPLQDNDDADWTYIGEFLVGEDFGDKYGISSAVSGAVDDRVVVAVGADSRYSGRVHVQSGIVTT